MENGKGRLHGAYSRDIAVGTGCLSSLKFITSFPLFVSSSGRKREKYSSGGNRRNKRSGSGLSEAIQSWGLGDNDLGRGRS